MGRVADNNNTTYRNLHLCSERAGGEGTDNNNNIYHLVLVHVGVARYPSPPPFPTDVLSCMGLQTLHVSSSANFVCLLLQGLKGIRATLVP